MSLYRQRASSFVGMDSVGVEMVRMVDDFVKRCRMSFAGAWHDQTKVAERRSKRFRRW
jgi:hypothetical protein